MDGGATTVNESAPQPESTPGSTSGSTPESTPESTPDPTSAATPQEEAIRETTKQVDQMSQEAASAVDLPDFGQSATPASVAGIGLLGDVDLDVRIELGRTRMLVDDVLKLSPESVVELDKAAGDPVDIYVNDRHVARGEVLVLNENFCVRVNEIIGGVTGTGTGTETGPEAG